MPEAVGGADLAVRPGNLGPGLGPVRGPALAAGQTPLAAGQTPLVAGQVLFPAGQVAGVGDLLAAGGDGEVLDTEVRTGISVVPAARMWTPLSLAAQAATLAQLSSGRFVLGLGTGGYGPGSGPRWVCPTARLR